MKKLLWLLFPFLIVAGVAFGQSSPNWTYGFVPTPGQWNALWAGKQNTLGYTPLNKGGDVMQGRLVTIAPVTNSGFNITPGSSPASPVNGDIWTTSGGVFAYINGGTVSLGSAAGTVTAGGSLTNNQVIVGAGGSTINALAAGTTAQVLIGGSAPAWGAVNLGTMVSSTLPVANGGTATGTAGIGAVNNISGRSYSGFSGTGNLAGTASPAWSGTVTHVGSSSGTISEILQTAAGTWNWEWPTTAGSSGQVLASAGGTGPMTWATVATTGPTWKWTSNSQSISTSTATTVNIVNSIYDTASICNSTTHVCTPTTAGYYLVECLARIDATAGPFIEGAIADTQIFKNSSKIEDFSYSAPLNMGATVSSGFALVSTIVQVNGSTDTLSCKGYSDGASGVTIIYGAFQGAFIHA